MLSFLAYSSSFYLHYIFWAVRIMRGKQWRHHLYTHIHCSIVQNIPAKVVLTVVGIAAKDHCPWHATFAFLAATKTILFHFFSARYSLFDFVKLNILFLAIETAHMADIFGDTLATSVFIWNTSRTLSKC